MYYIIIIIIIILLIIFFLQKQHTESFVESDAIIYVLYHDDNSYKIAQLFEKYEWAQLYKLGNSILFENAFFPILQTKQQEWETKQYVGLVSYNIVKKQSLKYFPLRRTIEESDNADVIAFFKYSGKDLITQATYFHPKFLDIWLDLLLKMGFDMKDILSDKIPMYPCNCWIAKPEWMKRYIEFVMKAIHIMDTDDYIKKLLYTDSGYRSNLSKKQLIKISGQPYYTHHPFVLERLSCFFFWVNNAKVFSKNIGVPIMNY
jgi:hypothetical protein